MKSISDAGRMVTHMITAASRTLNEWLWDKRWEEQMLVVCGVATCCACAVVTEKKGAQDRTGQISIRTEKE